MRGSWLNAVGGGGFVAAASQTGRKSGGHGDLGHHDTAEALADAGFVAVAINHPICGPHDSGGKQHQGYRNQGRPDGHGVLLRPVPDGTRR
jgi:hypothetical protein